MTASSAPWLLAAWVLLLLCQCNAMPAREQLEENREVLEANSGARMFHEPASGGAESGVVDMPLTAEDVTRWFNTRLTPDVVNRIMDAADNMEPLPQFFDEGRLIPYSVNGYKGPPDSISDVEPMIDLRLVYSAKTEAPPNPLAQPQPDFMPQPPLPDYNKPLLPAPPPPIVYPSPTRPSQPPTPQPDYKSEPLLSDYKPQSSLPPLGIHPPPPPPPVYKSQPPTPQPDHNPEPLLSDYKPQSSLPPLGIYPPPVYKPPSVYKPQPISINYKSQPPTPQPDHNPEPLDNKPQSSLPSLGIYPPPPPPPIYKTQPISLSFEPTPMPVYKPQPVSLIFEPAPLPIAPKPALDLPAYNSPPPPSPPPPPPIVYDPNYKSSPPPETLKPASSPPFEPQPPQNSLPHPQYIQLNSIPNTSQRLVIIIDPNQLFGQSNSIPLSLLTLPPEFGEPTTGTGPAYVARSGTDYVASQSDLESSQRLLSSIMDPLETPGQRSASTSFDKPSFGTDSNAARSGEGTSTRPNRSFVSETIDHFLGLGNQEGSRDRFQPGRGQQNGQWNSFGNQMMGRSVEETARNVARSGEGTSTRPNRSFVSEAVDHFSGLGDEEEGSRDRFQPGRGQQNGQGNFYGNQMTGRRVEETDPNVARGAGTSTRQNRSFVSQAIDHFSGLGDEEGSRDRFQPGRRQQNGQGNSHGNQMMGGRGDKQGSQDHFQPGRGQQNGQWNSNSNPMMGQDFAASRY